MQCRCAGTRRGPVRAVCCGKIQDRHRKRSVCELYGRQVQIVLYEEPHSGLGGSINLEEPTHPLKTPESLSLACPKLLLHCFEVVCESRACPKVLLHKKKGRQMCSIHCDKKEFKSRLSESARSKIIVTMHLSYTCEQTNKCLHAVMPTVDITKKNAMDHSSTNFFFFAHSALASAGWRKSIGWFIVAGLWYILVFF